MCVVHGGKDPDALRRPTGSTPPSASLRATSNCLLAQDDIAPALRVRLRSSFTLPKAKLHCEATSLSQSENFTAMPRIASPALQPFSLAPRCQHIELRSNISSAKHISNLLCLQSKYIAPRYARHISPRCPASPPLQGKAYLSRRQDTPGRSLPSRNSSDAPPPVEM